MAVTTVGGKRWGRAARQSLGQAFYNIGRHDADDQLEILITLAPERGAEICHSLGMMKYHEGLSRYPAAAGDFRKLLERYPDSPYAAQARAMLVAIEDNVINTISDRF